MINSRVESPNRIIPKKMHDEVFFAGKPIHRVWCIGLRSVLVGVLYLEVQLTTKSLGSLIDFSGIVGSV